MSMDNNIVNIVVIIIFGLMIYILYDWQITNLDTFNSVTAPGVLKIAGPGTDSEFLQVITNPSDLQKFQNDSENKDEKNTNIFFAAGLGPEVRRLGELETKLRHIEHDTIKNSNLLAKLYERDTLGNYMTHGWFVETFDVINSPYDILLGSPLAKYYGIQRICYRSLENFPFLGSPMDPVYMPKREFVGFRAMTAYKIPKTGYYSFRVLSDDGSRLHYQVVDSDIAYTEKNVKNTWNTIIDQWRFQSETWNTSAKIYLNQSDLLLLRFDYFQSDGNSTACIKVRYTKSADPDEDINDEPYNELTTKYTDLDPEDLYCSLLWGEVPQLGIQ